MQPGPRAHALLLAPGGGVEATMGIAVLPFHMHWARNAIHASQSILRFFFFFLFPK